jgi:predicted membrane metal-binding protein
VVRGLAVGDQQAIGNEAWQVFARTGTSHLMAISGFHIGMVAWLFAWLGSRLVLLPAAQRWRWTVPDLRAVFGMSAAFGYSLLAGMSVPTQRTLLMLAVPVLACCARDQCLAKLWSGLAAGVAGGSICAAGHGCMAVVRRRRESSCSIRSAGRRASGWRGFLSMQ